MILPYKAHIVDTLHHQWYLHKRICLLDSIPTLVLLAMDFRQSFTYLQVIFIFLQFEKKMLLAAWKGCKTCDIH